MFLSKSKILLVVGVLLFCGAMSAGWWKTFGGAENEIGNCIQITSDGNYIISGKRNGTDPWLIKTDTSGNAIWDKLYSVGPSYPPRSRWLEETVGGDFIIATSTPSLLKVNSQGDTLWSKDCGVESFCVQETSEGGYIVVGHSDFTEELVLVKTNSFGEVLWTQQYGGPERNLNGGRFIRRTSDNGYIITGFTGISSEEYGSTVLWLLKTDENGDTLWTKEYGAWANGEVTHGRCVIETSDSGFVITGYKDFNSGGLWLLKTDKNGDTLWTKTYRHPTEGGTGFCVQETQNSCYIIVGTTASIAYLYSFEPAGTYLWLLKTDHNGDTLWSRIYGSESGVAQGFCVQQTDDKGYVVVGYTDSYGAGGTDVYLLKTDSLGLLTIKENPVPKQPNGWEALSSIGREIVLRYWEMPQGLNASVYDASGRQVDKLHQTGAKGSITWGTGHPSGVYFIQVRDNRNTVNTERVVLTR